MSATDVREILATFSKECDARMDGDLRQSPVPANSSVYHYTDAHGLKGIVEKDAIWLTNRVHLNDPTELAYGLGFAIDWCEKQRRSVNRRPTLTSIRRLTLTRDVGYSSDGCCGFGCSLLMA
jgi:hypothetical protein